MAFFDDVKKKVTQAGHSAAKSARDFSETAKLNSQISDAQKQINQLYTQIGYEIYCAHNADPLPEVAQLIEQLNALHTQIEGLQAQIQTINAGSICPAAAQRSAPAWRSAPAAGQNCPSPSLPSLRHPRTAARCAEPPRQRTPCSAPAAAPGSPCRRS